jgi:hypothetical protein
VTSHLRFLLLLVCACAVWAGDAPPAVVGITRIDGPRFNAEHVRFDASAAFYRERGILTRFVEYRDFSSSPPKPEVQAAWMRQCHVIVLRTHEEGWHRFTPAAQQCAERIGQALQAYVASGGGLVLQVRPVRYQNDEDERFWNHALAPLGVQLLHEGVFDPSDAIEVAMGTHHRDRFFYTANILAHPVTADVAGLWLPLHSYYPNAGTPALAYGPEWTAVVKGGPQAKSFRSHAQRNEVELDQPGTYAAEPPIVAVRALGKGRIVSIAIDEIFTGLNLGVAGWSQTAESAGDPASGRRSDVMALMAGAMRWAAGPALADAAFGGAPEIDTRPVAFAAAKSWDRQLEPVRGIIGAHSALSDGAGTVAEYAAAARAAGLSFIVFSDPLELLTEVKLAELKRQCAAASSADFYASPGVEFTDGSGVRWAFLGEKVVWPQETYVQQAGRGTYRLWEGGAMQLFGRYAEQCNYPPSAVLSYRQLRERGAVPENLWWFNNVFPYVHEDGRLVADNLADWFFALRDLRLVSPLTFDRIRSPGQVAGSARVAVTACADLAAARRLLNQRCAPYWAAKDATQSTSYGDGPQVLAWKAVNDQMEEHWQKTRGAQRARLSFSVRSRSGIAEVEIHDADRGIIRRFEGGGEQLVSREFELVHDGQRQLSLVVRDRAGGTALSSFIFLFCYKQGLYRCGDNLNILGPLGQCWHPDRNENFQLTPYFRNAEAVSIQGWDRAAPDGLIPDGRLCDWVRLQSVGDYPDPGDRDRMPGRRMDVRLASHNLQIVDMASDSLVERFDNQSRPGPSFASIARKLSDNAWFTRFHRILSPADRTDHFVVWNHRRLREGTAGCAASYLWHEGEFRFRAAAVLDGAIPVPLLHASAPVAPGTGALAVGDADRGPILLRQEGGRWPTATGRLAPGGHVAQLGASVGCIAIFAPAGSDLAYSAEMGGRLHVGVGRPGQKVEAGEVLRYRFLAGNLLGDVDSARLERVGRAFNLAGGQAGYPLAVRTGSVEDAVFALKLRADGGQVRFAAGPNPDLGIDLPIRVGGIADNGCAAVFSTVRPWFRFVPVADGAAWFQEPVDAANDIWAGNIFTCSDPAIRLTLVADGQDPGRPPFLEVHNPGKEAAVADIGSPAGTPLFGGTELHVAVPAGSSVQVVLRPAAGP